ncbi:MAG: hypothetical protein JEZ14_17675 [Marinilabiliaceae bacterium]|nr:hypothetical protein [Marinilabiliaceae bacterium]
MTNLNELGVQEMSAQEVSEVNGGSWVSRAWNNTVDALESAYQWCKDNLNLDIELGRV